MKKRWKSAVLALALFLGNLWLVRGLLTIEYLDQMGSIEGARIALSRWIARELERPDLVSALVRRDSLREHLSAVVARHGGRRSGADWFHTGPRLPRGDGGFLCAWGR